MSNVFVAEAPRLATLPLPMQAPTRRVERAGTLGFVLFLLLNVTLFIRPGDVLDSIQTASDNPASLQDPQQSKQEGQAPQPANVPHSSLASLPIYEITIVACCLVCAPVLIKQLLPEAIIARPITFFVFMMFVAIVLSQAAQGSMWGMRTFGWSFLKIIPFYLLLVGVIDSVKRLRIYLGVLVVCTLGLTIIALLRYYGVITIGALNKLEERQWDWQSQTWTLLIRLRSTGMFNDPNDLSVMLSVAMIICAYFFTDKACPALRPVWLFLMALFGFGFMLTQSRGGMVALAFAGFCFCGSRFGWRKTILLAVLVLPLAKVALAGRQTDVSTDTGTGQQRIQLWGQAIVWFETSPIFGIGAGQLVEVMRHVAHNSYVHCLAELGIFGGTCFIAIPFLAVTGMFGLQKYKPVIAENELRRLHPYVLAMVACFAAGLLTLTRCYVIPTYLVLGLAVVYFRLVSTNPIIPLERLGVRLFVRVGAISALNFTATYLFVRLFAHWGGGGGGGGA